MHAHLAILAAEAWEVNRSSSRSPLSEEVASRCVVALIACRERLNWRASRVHGQRTMWVWCCSRYGAYPERADGSHQSRRGGRWERRLLGLLGREEAIPQGRQGRRQCQEAGRDARREAGVERAINAERDRQQDDDKPAPLAAPRRTQQTQHGCHEHEEQADYDDTAENARDGSRTGIVFEVLSVEGAVLGDIDG